MAGGERRQAAGGRAGDQFEIVEQHAGVGGRDAVCDVGCGTGGEAGWQAAEVDAPTGGCAAEAEAVGGERIGASVAQAEAAAVSASLGNRQVLGRRGEETEPLHAETVLRDQVTVGLAIFLWVLAIACGDRVSPRLLHGGGEREGKAAVAAGEGVAGELLASTGIGKCHRDGLAGYAGSITGANQLAAETHGLAGDEVVLRGADGGAVDRRHADRGGADQHVVAILQPFRHGMIRIGDSNQVVVAWFFRQLHQEVLAVAATGSQRAGDGHTATTRGEGRANGDVIAVAVDGIG